MVSKTLLAGQSTSCEQLDNLAMSWFVTGSVCRHRPPRGLITGISNVFADVQETLPAR